VLVVCGAFIPRALYYPSKVWWRFAIALGWVNARIILTIAFVIVLTPHFAVWRLIGRDPLQRRRDGWKGWTPYPERYRRAITSRKCTRGNMAKSRVLKEFWQFLMAEKKYWLLPIVIVFVLFGLLIVFSQSSAVAPFIYTLF
jgi:hypothetical protein